MNPILLRAFVAVTFVLLGLVFWLFPGIDLWTTGLFYDGGFPRKEDGWVKMVYHGVPILAGAAAVSLSAALVIAVARRRPLGPLTARASVYFLCVLAVGPGLVINGILKRFYGRARPRDVVEFGGGSRFTPAFVVSDQCDRNCSFAAGHPSPLFCLFGAGLMASRRRWRLLWHTAAVLLGGIVGLARIVEGAHFLSDVVFSGVFVFLTAWLLHRAFFRSNPVSVVAPKSPTPA